MELKKILTLLILILLNTSVYAELTEPNKRLEPYDVVKIQLEALKNNNKDIKKFCESNFGISFPLTEKTNVIGTDAHPFYKWAKKNYGIGAIPKWNFHKIVVDKSGKITDTFASFTKPSSKKFINSIEKEIKN